MPDLTLTVTGSITIDSRDYKIAYARTVQNLVSVYDNLPLVPIGSFVELFKIGTNPGRGEFTDVKFLWIENTDPTNFVTLSINQTGGADEAFIKLAPSEFFVLGTKDFQVDAAGGGFAAFVAIETVEARADTAACRVRVLAFDDA